MVDPIPFTDLYLSGRVTADQKAQADREDKVAVAATLDFSADFNYIVDFTVINQANITGLIKSMFIDNSENPNEVVVFVQQTQQRFTFPARSEGYVPVTATFTTKISLESDGGGSQKTSVVFYNYDIPGFIWYKFGNNPVDAVINAQGTMQVGDDIAASQNNLPVFVASQDTNGDLRPFSLTPEGALAVTVDDGADVAQGAINDARYTDDTGAANGTIISLLKGLFVSFTNLFTGSASISTGQTTIGVVATFIVPAEPNRRSVTLINTSNLDVFIGEAGVTLLTGMLLPPDTPVTIETTAAIFGVEATGTAIVTSLETIN